jgi:hypothetical protein
MIVLILPIKSLPYNYYFITRDGTGYVKKVERILVRREGSGVGWRRVNYVCGDSQPLLS